MLLEHWAIGAERALAARRRLGADRFVDVAQRELQVDPDGTAQRVYDSAGLRRSEEVVAATASWVDEQHNARLGAHVYSLEAYGLTEADVTDAFAGYLQEFGELCRRPA